MVRTFTLEEANQSIPRIAAVLRRTAQLGSHLRAGAVRLAAAGVGPSDTTHADPAIDALLTTVRLVEEAIGEDVGALEALGVVVRDAERGLVDFRSVLDGEREVFLCWQLGEAEVRFFHDVDAGFAGRQPIDGHRFFRSRQLQPPSE